MTEKIKADLAVLKLNVDELTMTVTALESELITSRAETMMTVKTYMEKLASKGAVWFDDDLDTIHKIYEDAVTTIRETKKPGDIVKLSSKCNEDKYILVIHDQDIRTYKSEGAALSTKVLMGL